MTSTGQRQKNFNILDRNMFKRWVHNNTRKKKPQNCLWSPVEKVCEPTRYYWKPVNTRSKDSSNFNFLLSCYVLLLINLVDMKFPSNDSVNKKK